MTDTTNTSGSNADDSTVTIVQVPDEHAQKVMEYVTNLQKEAEVSGFAFSRPVASGPISGTGCSLTGGTLNPSDFNCKDSDAPA
jgi:hypothetical protein